MMGLIKPPMAEGFFCPPTADAVAPAPAPAAGASAPAASQQAAEQPPPGVGLKRKLSRIDDHQQIERETMYWMQEFDANQRLGNTDVDQVLDDLFEAIDAADLTEVDGAFIRTLVKKLVQPILDRYEKEDNERLRMPKGTHAVCNLGAEWSSGIIQAVNEPNPQMPWLMLPYVIHLDPPVSRLISAPEDSNGTIRPEVCFGQNAADGLMFTLACLPVQQKSKSVPRRFVVGERVACLIEDSVDDPQGTVWAAGTVSEVDVNMEKNVSDLLPERDFPFGVPPAPYRVALDKGCSVLVHKDEHWLVRDLAYQTEGPCHCVGPSRRPVERIERQQHGDKWVTIDHTTRKVRPG